MFLNAKKYAPKLFLKIKTTSFVFNERKIITTI